MGCRNREFTDDETVSSSSLSEALLFATMCIIGLPVDVHVKDGSVYSGIFYTASVENEYGIVLKKARMTKKGKSDANVGNGTLIDTLVILSGDLVQVVAKGVLLPAADIAGNMAGDKTEAVTGTVPSDVCIKNDAKKPIESAINKKKLNGVSRGPMQNGNGLAHGVTSTGAGKEHEGRNLPLKHGGNTMEVEHGKGEGMNLSECKMLLQADKVNDKKMTSKRLPSGVSCDPVTVIVNSDNQCCERTTSADISSDVVSSGVSTSFNPAADASCRRLVATSTEMVHPQGPEFNRSAKEFKLNPGAKTFSPSFTKPITSTPPSVPTVVSMGYIPNNSPVVAVPAAQPEVGSNPFPSRSSVPVKVVPYNNFTNGHGGSGSQFSQPIVGHVGSRVQTLRYPVQAGPTYVHPNSQAVMVGRFGQVVYMHPVSQGATAMSALPARPVLTPHQVQFPKHQGPAAAQAFQLCVPPPFMATGQQPFPIAKTHPLFATSLPF
ncbi:uncharacterized protein LOC117626614 isoform X3 [Prunus dulcis]|uniref:uncharacterized protein LOC117626614 isoform X3 n=1 Tax=Prunus dulcis TaxID=3755 RepID=UPI0014829EB4|nr:uncharacterized protein LOC117626614 isoform X3 [Prunus dulcis]